MVQEFSVQNYLSFKDRQTLHLLATADDDLKEELTYQPKKGVYLLRLGLIYGPNASGKSNLLQAIQALWMMMFRSREKEDEEIELYNPFATQTDQPVEFEVVFWVREVKYSYKLQYSKKSVLYEQLKYTTDASVLALVYERKGQDEFKFGGTLEMKAAQKRDLVRETLHNHTLLSTLNKKNIAVPQPISQLYHWLKENVHELGVYNDAVEIAQQADKNESFKKLVLKLLQHADLDISDFKVVETAPPEHLKEEIRAEGIPERWKARFLRPQKNLIITHKTQQEVFELGFNMESAGTRIYFRLARILFDLGNGGHIVMEDEIEDSLHYDLLTHYLQTYLQFGGNNSQLLATTHNLLLLNEDWMIRRDMVWLVDKDRKTGASILTRVSDLGLHKNRSLLNAYKIGKLGGKPNLGSTILSEF